MASRPAVVVIKCFGDAWTPWEHKLEPISPVLPPHRNVQAIGARSPSHSSLSCRLLVKGELIKGPFKWLPFQSYYFPITKGEQIEISSLICCFPLLLIGVFVRAQQKSSPHFSCQSSGCNTGAHGCNFRLLKHSRTVLFSENRVKQVTLQTLWQITHATKNL